MKRERYRYLKFILKMCSIEFLNVLIVKYIWRSEPENKRNSNSFPWKWIRTEWNPSHVLQNKVEPNRVQTCSTKGNSNSTKLEPAKVGSIRALTTMLQEKNWYRRSYLSVVSEEAEKWHTVKVFHCKVLKLQLFMKSVVSWARSFSR